jgi:hypothetical protein
MFFDNDPEITKHGYYEVDGVKTFSKFEAYKFAGNDISKVKFIYNEDIMTQQDWSTEPTEDIYELYAERARQLRGKYDYLVLLFSGGVDSYTVLTSFLENNIHLDEICTFNNEVEHRTDLFNQEVFKAAIPFVNTLNLGGLRTKFRLLDISRLVIDQFSDEFNFEHMHLYNQGNANNWNNATRSHILKSKIQDHMTLTEQGKSVCYIWGFDKPFMRWEDNRYYIHFVDNSIDLNMRQYINRKQLVDKFSNFYDEPFFTCRESPKIAIKQGHLLFNLIKTIDSTDARLQSFDQVPTTGPFVMHHRSEYFRFLPKKMVDGAIYPRANLLQFGDDKVRGSILLTSKDNWFNHSNHENQHKWQQNLTNLVQENQGFYRFKNNKLMSTNHILSQPYCIGEFNVFENGPVDANKK